MKVGWIGLGKLGLPCALALEQYGNVGIVGYDLDPRLEKIISGKESVNRIEHGLADLLDGTLLDLAGSISEVVRETDGIVFVAVQTPHAAEYGGEQPMPSTRRDFDYTALQAAVEAVSAAADDQGKRITLVIVSTVLPGTIRTRILPTLSDNVTVVYNPFLIAMGTTIQDFLHPEFVLVGCERPEDALPLWQLYDRLHDAEIRVMSLESAELTKVAYNTFISLKIIFANTLMEISEAIGSDVDEVIDTLALATDRITSPAYLRGGMGDGGACHPRDNIAMSWLARNLGLYVDPFEFVTRSREAQSEWLAYRIKHEAENRGLPVVLLGKAYKPESDLTYGSPALLLAHQLRQLGVEFTHWDHFVDGGFTVGEIRPSLYVICTKHKVYQDELAFPYGSAIIDPHRYVNPRPNVKIVALGRGWRD